MTATETAGTIRRMIFEGGAINWFIIALYFFMLLVAAERAVFYGATFYNRKKVMAAVRALQTEKELKDFLSQPWPGHYLNSVPFCIIREFCHRFENDAVVLNEALDLRFSLLQRRLNSRIDVLSMLANVAPLCGLLGTVTGLMAAFDAIERHGGSVEMGALAGGIWEAMITTATGLVVAIPALLFIKVFDSLMNRRIEDGTIVCSILKQKFRPDCLAETGRQD